MSRTVKEAADLAGVSVRTLHYYDEIGLLRPSKVSPAGYRYYDDAAMAQLHRILIYRELEMPLKEVARMLSCPKDEKLQTLTAHRERLLFKRRRLDALIALVDEMTGGDDMDKKQTTLKRIRDTQRAYADEAQQSGATARHGARATDDMPATPTSRRSPLHTRPTRFSAHSRPAWTKVQKTPQCSRWWRAGSSTSRSATTYATRVFWQVLGRCMWWTNASRSTSTALATGLPPFSARPLPVIVNKNRRRNCSHLQDKAHKHCVCELCLFVKDGFFASRRAA